MAFVETSRKRRVEIKHVTVKAQYANVILTFRTVDNKMFSVSMGVPEGKRLAERLFAVALSATPAGRAIRRYGSVVFRA